MFGLFSSKNQKLVKKWKKEHEQIVILAHNVIAAYSKNDLTKTRKELIALNDIAVTHLMGEDLSLYKLLKDTGNLDNETEKLILEFKHTFKTTKTALMNFLRVYTRPEAILDDEFFKNFNGIVEVLAKRIEFEEKNLYSQLDTK